jgi:hypothetical protein
MSNQYSKRDLLSLEVNGEHYSKHVVAMTTEGLHSESSIAAELAYRDAEIDRLKKEIAGYELANRDLSNWHDALKFDYDELSANKSSTPRFTEAYWWHEVNQAHIKGYEQGRLSGLCEASKLK